MTPARALITLIALTVLVHLATRVGMGLAQCVPTHCQGGPTWQR
jgi:hypothetical protein